MSYEFDKGIPIYRQIENIVTRRILSGTYSPNGELPTVRDLAMEFSVNPNTVQRAYSALEAIGIAEAKRTTGRYVTDNIALLNDLRDKQALEILISAQRQIAELGIDKEKSLQLWKEATNL